MLILIVTLILATPRARTGTRLSSFLNMVHYGSGAEAQALERLAARASLRVKIQKRLLMPKVHLKGMRK